MGDQRTQLVEQRDHRGHGQRDQQGFPAKGEDAADQRPAPHHAARLLQHHPATQVAFGVLAAEIGIDRKRAEPLPRQPADRRNDCSQRNKHCEAQQQRDRREQRDKHECGQAPRFHQRQRKVFGIRDRAILRALVMQRVHAFIHEGRRQHGHADQRVPRGPEARQRSVTEMRDFVDEQQGAIQREHRDHAQNDCQREAVDEDRARQRAISHQRRPDHVGPVDVGAMRSDVLGQVARGAQHGLVVGNLGMPARSRVATRNDIGSRNLGLLHVHGRLSWGVFSRKHTRNTAPGVDHSDRVRAFP